MIGRSNTGGGGGSLSPNSAVIHVTAPIGSTITLSKGGVVVKVLTPDKSHINAGNASLADWYYSVGSSNYGTWTVNAQLSMMEKSESVVVDTNKQYNVDLSGMVGYLYNNGAENPLYTSDLINSGSGCTITKESAYIQIYCKNKIAGAQYYRVANVDLTDVGTIRYTGQAYCDASNQGVNVKIFIADSQDTIWAADAISSVTVDVRSTSYANFTETLDVSNFSGQYYVACGQDTNKGNWANNRYVRIRTLSLLP